VFRSRVWRRAEISPAWHCQAGTKGAALGHHRMGGPPARPAGRLCHRGDNCVGSGLAALGGAASCGHWQAFAVGGASLLALALRAWAVWNGPSLMGAFQVGP